MKRLTMEIELPFDSTYVPRCGAIEMGEEVGMTKMLAYDGICRKLGQREDIEDKLGIDLITYVSLTQNGFFGMVSDGHSRKPHPFPFHPRDFIVGKDGIVVYWQGSDRVYCSFEYRDYGKKAMGGWALTEEELE